MQRLRTYTVEEANQELPRVRRIVKQIADLSALVPELEDQARIAEYESKRNGAVAALNGMGIQLKGPLEGLIDFPSYRDGELVELCWKLGEDKVEHWHRVNEGYAGRKRL